VLITNLASKVATTFPLLLLGDGCLSVLGLHGLGEGGRRHVGKKTRQDEDERKNEGELEAKAGNDGKWNERGKPFSGDSTSSPHPLIQRGQRFHNRHGFHVGTHPAT
jgi:hypothetical protein